LDQENFDDSLSIKMLRAGTTDAFGSIVEHYQAQIFSYLFRLTREHELARDLAQDTFVQAYEGILKTQNITNLRAWLYRIATNNAYKHFRRAKILSFLSLDHHKTPVREEVEAEVSEQIEIREALRAVPLNMRICLLLHLVYGFKYREIAAMQGISEDAVRMRVARGKHAFIQYYQGGKKDEV